MTLRSDLETKVKDVYGTQWTSRDGRVIPSQDDIGLGNEGVNLELTMLYADLSGSTALVDNYKTFYAAEQYKAFLFCAAKIIRSEGGEIRSYDGDRSSKNSCFAHRYTRPITIKSFLHVAGATVWRRCRRKVLICSLVISSSDKGSDSSLKMSQIRPIRSIISF